MTDEELANDVRTATENLTVEVVVCVEKLREAHAALSRAVTDAESAGLAVEYSLGSLSQENFAEALQHMISGTAKVKVRRITIL